MNEHQLQLAPQVFACLTATLNTYGQLRHYREARVVQLETPQ